MSSGATFTVTLASDVLKSLIILLSYTPVTSLDPLVVKVQVIGHCGSVCSKVGAVRTAGTEGS